MCLTNLTKQDTCTQTTTDVVRTHHHHNTTNYDPCGDHRSLLMYYNAIALA